MWNKREGWQNSPKLINGKFWIGLERVAKNGIINNRGVPSIQNLSVKTLVWKSVVFELLQFENLLNKGILLRQWRELFISFPSGKKKSYLKSFEKLFLYFSQINIRIFWKYQQEMFDINWPYIIIHQQL